MRICIMHFASSLLRIFLATLSFLEFLYGILLVLSRCCFHHIVENSILYKKDIQHFYIGPILYSENKIIRSVEKLTVKFYLVPGVRNRKFYLAPGMRNGKIYLAPNDSFEKFYLAVKGLRTLRAESLYLRMARHFAPRHFVYRAVTPTRISSTTWTSGQLVRS